MKRKNQGRNLKTLLVLLRERAKKQIALEADSLQANGMCYLLHMMYCHDKEMNDYEYIAISRWMTASVSKELGLDYGYLFDSKEWKPRIEWLDEKINNYNIIDKHAYYKDLNAHYSQASLEDILGPL